MIAKKVFTKKIHFWAPFSQGHESITNCNSCHIAESISSKPINQHMHYLGETVLYLGLFSELMGDS